MIVTTMNSSQLITKYFKLEMSMISGIFIRVFHLVLTVSIICVLIFMDTELKDAINDRNIFLISAFTALVTVSGSLYFAASLMDPGYVPKGKERRKATFTVSLSSSSDDSEEDCNIESEAAMMLGKLRRRKCDSCCVEQPVRSKHCSECGRCVRKFDHHCPWLENCVGERNHKYFWLFLLCEMLLVLWAIKLTWSGFRTGTTPDSWLKMNAIILIAFLVLLFSGFVVGSLFCCHTFMMFTNQTTWEFMARHRITYLKNIGEDVNPFDEGYIRNCLKFLCSCAYKPWELALGRHYELQKV
ncbi:palmitoyltransferase ZDHHC12-B-like [Antedon mediterranea]|uniref:palmitoyltransferase ZDHHC12-B-like n=1 Tax=Antedon mediterranea TaxID=105859 RepID=UPI003AF5A321